MCVELGTKPQKAMLMHGVVNLLEAQFKWSVDISVELVFLSTLRSEQNFTVQAQVAERASSCRQSREPANTDAQRSAQQTLYQNDLAP
jgi:hypothetical protein